MAGIGDGGGPPAENESGETVQVVSFMVGNEEYALDVLNIQEIDRPMEITEVPRSAPFVRGVANLRGRVIPVLDLGAMLGRTPSGSEHSVRIIVVNHGTKTFGLAVDAVNEVLHIPVDRIEPTPHGSRMANCFRGVAKLEGRLVVLLHLGKLAESHGIGSSTPLAA